MLPKKIFKIGMLRLAENEFHTTKFLDFSLTFLDFFKFPDFLFVSKFPDIYRFFRLLDTLQKVPPLVSHQQKCLIKKSCGTFNMKSNYFGPVIPGNLKKC